MNQRNCDPVWISQNCIFHPSLPGVTNCSSIRLCPTTTAINGLLFPVFRFCILLWCNPAFSVDCYSVSCLIRDWCKRNQWSWCFGKLGFKIFTWCRYLLIKSCCVHSLCIWFSRYSTSSWRLVEPRGLKRASDYSSCWVQAAMSYRAIVISGSGEYHLLTVSWNWNLPTECRSLFSKSSNSFSILIAVEGFCDIKFPWNPWVVWRI